MIKCQSDMGMGMRRVKMMRWGNREELRMMRGDEYKTEITGNERKRKYGGRKNSKTMTRIELRSRMKLVKERTQHAKNSFFRLITTSISRIIRGNHHHQLQT